MEAELAVLALLVAAYALVAARLERHSFGPALVFLAIGMVMSDDLFGPISLDPGAEPVKLLAEVTLTLLLFADASTIRAGALRQDAAAVARLLGIGLPLTIILGTAGALLLFPGISLGIALLIGAALAPTDAALGQPVVTNPVVPARVRRLLNIESGLNDGIATPVVFVALALATAEATGRPDWVGQAFADAAIGVAVGAGIGLLGGYLLVLADRAHWTSSVSRQLSVMALALACYLVAVSVGGNGFIAAFVGGLAFGGGSRQREEGALRFTESEGSLLAIGVWAAFGLALAGEMRMGLEEPAVIVYALLSLTVIRMVPVAIGLMGSRFAPVTVVFMGWFGPRGLASIVFLVVGLDGLSAAGVDAGPLRAVIVWTVVLSVVLHGLTAGPLATRYGRLAASLPPASPELEAAAEPRPSRVWWSGSGQMAKEPEGGSDA